MIHQTNAEATSNVPSNYYNVSQGHQYDRAPKSDSVYLEAGQITSSIHGQNEDRVTRSAAPLDHQAKRSGSAVSDSSSAASVGAVRFERASAERTSTTLRNSNQYRSLGAIPRDPSAEMDQGLSPSNRAASLDFRKRSDGQDESGSLFLRHLGRRKIRSLFSNLRDAEGNDTCGLRIREHTERMATKTESKSVERKERVFFQSSGC